jgi:hypothetical protein
MLIEGGTTLLFFYYLLKIKIVAINQGACLAGSMHLKSITPFCLIRILRKPFSKFSDFGQYSETNDYIASPFNSAFLFFSRLGSLFKRFLSSQFIGSKLVSIINVIFSA